MMNSNHQPIIKWQTVGGFFALIYMQQKRLAEIEIKDKYARKYLKSYRRIEEVGSFIGV